MPPLTGVDYAILAVIGLSGLVSLLRGLVQEVFSLAAWGVAAWVALRYGPELAARLSSLIPLPSARVAAAFAALFLGCLAVASLAGFLLGKVVRGIGLAGIDRLAGLLFGVARGALIVSVLVMGAGATPLSGDPWWKASKLIPPFQSLAYWLRGQVPEDYASPFKFKSSTASHRDR